MFDQFLEDFKADRDPIVNLNATIIYLEQGRIDLEELPKIRTRLSKDPAGYGINNHNKKIRVLLDARAGDILSYYKINDKKKEVCQ